MRTLFHRILRRLSRVWRTVYASPGERDALYRLLYEVFHDLDDTPDTAALQTQDAFDHQWKELADGEAMLSDPWFKDNVTQILSEKELRIRPEWFKGKNVLDCGCGNGRWSYGFAKVAGGNEDRFAAAVITGAAGAYLTVASVSYGIWQNWWVAFAWALAVLTAMAVRSPPSG